MRKLPLLATKNLLDIRDGEEPERNANDEPDNSSQCNPENKITLYLAKHNLCGDGGQRACFLV